MYRVKGSDLNEYGPITQDQVRQWIAENRLNRNSQASREDSPGWSPLGSFPEFADALAAQTPAVAAVPATPTTSIPPNVPDASVGAYTQVGTREAALRMVSAPAILLIILAGVGCLMSLLSMVQPTMVTDWMKNLPNLPPQFEEALRNAENTPRAFGILTNLFGLVGNVLIVVGALKMKQLQSPALSWTATILACLPCFTCCCCLGLPVGIWSAIVLNKPDVKAHLR